MGDAVGQRQLDGHFGERREEGGDDKQDVQPADIIGAVTTRSPLGSVYSPAAARSASFSCSRSLSA